MLTIIQRRFRLVNRRVNLFFTVFCSVRLEIPSQIKPFPNTWRCLMLQGSVIKRITGVSAFASTEKQSAYPGALDVIIKDMVVSIDLFNDPYGVLQGFGELLLFMVRQRGLPCPLIFQNGKDI